LLSLNEVARNKPSLNSQAQREDAREDDRKDDREEGKRREGLGSA
jgi:hypothetical protein